MSKLSDLENKLAEAQGNLDVCTQMLALDPTDSDALESAPQFREEIKNLETRIAAKRAELDAALTPPPPSGNDPPPPPPKYDMSKHPKFQKSSSDASAPGAPATEDARLTFNTGDGVMARFSEDKQWYHASIISKTGSSTDPVYTVKFTGYGDKETKRKHEVRPVDNKKRKADGAPTASVPPPPTSPAPVNNGAVISAAPSVDPNLVKKREPSKVSDGPTRLAPEPKKLKGNKALDKAKSNWNDWQKSGPKKPALGGGKNVTKESQFRTPDLPNAKGKYMLTLMLIPVSNESAC